MTTANNAIYTPSPKVIHYFVLTLRDGRTIVRQDDRRNVVVDGLACQAVSVRREEARVVGRGNLCGDSHRWFDCELAGAVRQMLLGEGS